LLVRSPERLVGGDAAGGGGAAGAAGAGVGDQFREGRDEPEGLAVAGCRAQRLVATVSGVLSGGEVQWE